MTFKLLVVAAITVYGLFAEKSEEWRINIQYYAVLEFDWPVWLLRKFGSQKVVVKRERKDCGV